MTVRAGQWKAPTRFFACGRSIAVLPPIAASTCATRLVATRHPGDAAQICRGGEAGGVGRAAAAERDDRAARGRGAAHARAFATAASVFASSPGGSSCVSASLGPRASCAAAPWMPATCGSETSATGPSPGTSSPSRSSAPRSTITPAAARTTSWTSFATTSATSRVELASLLVEPAELGFVLRERAVAVPHALPARVDVDVEPDRRASRRAPRARAAR